MCHIIGIEPQFENIISNGPYIPITVGQRKPETQWTPEERKAANLDQRLKTLIMSMLLDDKMYSVINLLTTKSTWDNLIIYHDGPSDVKQSKVMDMKLCYNTFKFKEGESITQTFTRYKALMNELVNDGIKLSKLEINTGFINGLPKKWLAFCQSLRNTNHVKESELASLFDSPDDEEDTRSSQEYMNDLEKEYEAIALLAKSKWFFKKGTQRFSSAKATNQTECHKCGKKGYFAGDYWSKTLVPSYQSPFQPKLLHSSEHKPEPRHTKDFEAKYNKVKAKLALFSSKEVSFDEKYVTEVKALMALSVEQRVSVGKESARNGEWIKISMKKVHTLLEMEDNNDRKSFLDYLCIDLNYVEEQRNNLMSKHRNLVQKLNTYKEQLLVLKQAKLDLLTMQPVNNKILKENQNLINKPKELTSIIKACLNSSNNVNQYISEQIPTQKKKILGIDQLTEDTSSYGPKDPVFVKSSADNSEVSITSSNKPKLSVAEDSTLSNHYTSKHPLPPLEKMTGAEPVSGPKTIKSILKSKSTFKVETLKGITINEPSSAPARGNKSSSVSKTNSAPTGPPAQRHFINKERYVKDLLRKYDKIGSSVNTPITTPNMLGPDLNDKAVNESQYRETETLNVLDATWTEKSLQMLVSCLKASLFAEVRISSNEAMFSAKAEDIVAVGCYAIILWIKSQLTDYDIIYEKVPITI
ncbi:hypothetical protein Tco_0020475 [Tanacetum coccineum]